MFGNVATEIMECEFPSFVNDCRLLAKLPPHELIPLYSKAHYSWVLAQMSPTRHVSYVHIFNHLLDDVISLLKKFNLPVHVRLKHKLYQSFLLLLTKWKVCHHVFFVDRR